MIIPKGVNQAHFYSVASKQGVKVISRFPHVGIWRGMKGQALYWVAIVGKNKKSPSYLRMVFPFDEKGEEDAYNCAIEQKKRFGIKDIKKRVKREDPKILQRT